VGVGRGHAAQFFTAIGFSDAIETKTVAARVERIGAIGNFHGVGNTITITVGDKFTVGTDDGVDIHYIKLRKTISDVAREGRCNVKRSRGTLKIPELSIGNSLLYKIKNI